MRVNWFSLLPPADAAAAIYTARVLPFFKGRADVLLWTPQTIWDRGLERWAEVRSFEPGSLPWEEINQADAALFHLQGDRGDQPLLDVLELHAGLIVLHASPPRPDTWQRCLGAIVPERETFLNLKSHARRPLLLLPPPWAGSAHALTAYKDHVESLLTFADEARPFSLRLTADQLALKAAREMKTWTTDADRAPELPRTVREIATLTSRSTTPTGSRNPRAA